MSQLKLSAFRTNFLFTKLNFIEVHSEDFLLNLLKKNVHMDTHNY